MPELHLLRCTCTPHWLWRGSAFSTERPALRPFSKFILTRNADRRTLPKRDSLATGPVPCAYQLQQLWWLRPACHSGAAASAVLAVEGDSAAKGGGSRHESSAPQKPDQNPTSTQETPVPHAHRAPDTPSAEQLLAPACRAYSQVRAPEDGPTFIIGRSVGFRR